MSKDDPQGKPLLLAKTWGEGDSSLRCVGEVHIDSIGELEQRLLLVFVIWNVSPKDTHAAGLLLADVGSGQFKRVGFWETSQLLDSDTEEDRKAILGWLSTNVNNNMHTLQIV